MGAMVSAKWAGSDDDVCGGPRVVVVTREHEGRADQGEVGGRSRRRRDDRDRTIVASSSSLHRCREREGTAGQGEVGERSR